MKSGQISSAQADMSAANVKPQSGGRSQNYQAPEVKQSLDQAQKDKNAAGQAQAGSGVNAAPSSASK